MEFFSFFSSYIIATTFTTPSKEDITSVSWVYNGNCDIFYMSLCNILYTYVCIFTIATTLLLCTLAWLHYHQCQDKIISYFIKRISIKLHTHTLVYECMNVYMNHKKCIFIFISLDKKKKFLDNFELFFVYTFVKVYYHIYLHLGNLPQS